MSIDKFLGEKYDRRDNNCLHFACRAWKDLTGDSRLDLVVEGNMSSIRGAIRKFRQVVGPTESPSVVLMKNRLGEEHVGICYRKRLLHLTDGGASFFDIEFATPQFSDLRYFQ